jgi:two-component system phosphate regulon sensor histidine kinase PhoR
VCNNLELIECVIDDIKIKQDFIELSNILGKTELTSYTEKHFYYSQTVANAEILISLIDKFIQLKSEIELISNIDIISFSTDQFDKLLFQLEFIDSEDRQSIINGVYANSEELYLTLENLISWTKLQSDDIKIQISSISLRELFLKSIGNLKEKSNRKQINIKINISEIQINTDPELLSFVLRKIFSNALEFTPENGNITFSAVIKGKELEIICEDSGTGIEKNRIPKLENEIEFESSDDFITNKSTGLGMKICNRYIKMLRGSLKIESEIGKGTKIAIRLPNAV